MKKTQYAITIVLIAIIISASAVGALYYTGAFSPQPSPSPTPSPTVTPTTTPTETPSDSTSPTVAPTATPTTSPTASPTPTPEPTTRWVIDATGNNVTIPYTVDRVAVDVWITADLVWGVCGHDKIVCGPSYTSLTWQSTIYPSDATLPLSYNGSALNVETILASNPQVFFATDSKRADPVKATGLPVIILDNSNSTQLERSLLVIGEVLGGDSETKATQLVSYFDNTINVTSTKLANYYSGTTLESEKPRVLVMWYFPTAIYAYGANQAVGQSVAICGGVNVYDGTVSTVNIEQILAWDPDIIIGGGSLFNLTTMKNDAVWSQLDAVKNNQVYLVPGGLWGWLGPSPEWVLGIQWEAKLLNPPLFQDTNLTTEAIAFYSNYFGYQLTATQAERMLAALPPT
jgi:iron complex transport system substrate-binding protein